MDYWGDNMKLFTEHPNNVGETYFQHMKVALKYSLTFFGLGIVAFIHSIFPFMFVTTASDKVKELYSSFKPRTVKSEGE